MDRLWTRSFTLAILGTFLIFFGFYFLIPSLPPYAASLGASKEEIGFVVGIYSVAAVTVRFTTGSWLDRYGRKRFLVAGLLLFAVAAAGYAFSRSLAQLLALRVLHGIGWGWLTTAFGALVADLAPPSRRGEGIGYWGLGPPLAMATGPLVASVIMNRASFAAVFLGTAVLALVTLLLVLAIRDPQTRSAATASPLAILGTVRAPSLVLFLASLSYGSIIAFVPVQFDSGHAAGFFSIYSVSILLTRPLFGRLSDRFGRAAMIHPGFALSAVGTFLLGIGTPASLYAAAVLYGIGTAASFPAMMALIADLTLAESRSAAMAVFFGVYDVSIALGSGALGAVYQRWGFFALNATGAAAILVAQLLLALSGRRVRTQRA
jgi:Arabinose efflux permease